MYVADWTPDKVKKLVAHNLLQFLAREPTKTRAEQVRDSLALSAPQLSNIIKGRAFVSAATLSDICNIFGVSPYEVFLEEEQETFR